MADPRTPHQVMVQILEARGIETTKSSKKADMYIQVLVGPTARRVRTTRTRFGSVNAVFNESFTFENVLLTPSEFRCEKVAVRVFDRNVATRNSLVGACEAGLESIFHQHNHQLYKRWLPIYRPGIPCYHRGFVRVTMHVLGPKDATPLNDYSILSASADPAEKLLARAKDDAMRLTEPEMKTSFHILSVLLYRAEGLRGVSSGSRINPFFSVRFNGNTVQTRTFASNQSPFLNVRAEIPFVYPLFSNSIEVQVWDRLRGYPATLVAQHTLM